MKQSELCYTPDDFAIIIDDTVHIDVDMTPPRKRSNIREIVVPSLQRLARQEVERLHHFLLLYLLPCAFLDDNSSCRGRETRDLDFRHHYTRETQEVLAKTWSNLGKW